MFLTFWDLGQKLDLGILRIIENSEPGLLETFSSQLLALRKKIMCVFPQFFSHGGLGLLIKMVQGFSKDQ